MSIIDGRAVAKKINPNIFERACQPIAGKICLRETDLEKKRARTNVHIPTKSPTK